MSLGILFCGQAASWIRAFFRRCIKRYAWGILNAAPLGRIAFEASPEENASFARRTLLA